MYRSRPPRPRFEDVPSRALRKLLAAALSPNPTHRPTAPDLLAALDSPRAVRPDRARVRGRRPLAVAGAATAALVVLGGGLVWSNMAGPSADVPPPRCPTTAVTPPPTVDTPAAPDQIAWAAQPEFHATGETLYRHTFADGASGWPLGRTTMIESSTDGCAYLVHPLAKGDYAYLPAPAPDAARMSDEVVSATATLREGQGLWGVWCRGVDQSASNAYYFEISHTAAVRILVLDGSQYGGGTNWHHLDGVDVTQPTTIAARCADVPTGAPVQLTMAVNGRQVLSFAPSGTALLGPGYAGISALTFSDVNGPTAQEAFTNVAITRYR